MAELARLRRTAGAAPDDAAPRVLVMEDDPSVRESAAHAARRPRATTS